MKKILNYTWKDFDRDIKKIKYNNQDLPLIKTIIGVSKGGLPLAVKLTNFLNIPFKIICANSYDKNKKRKELCVEQFYPVVWDYPILLVDDIADTGVTLSNIVDQLRIWNKKVITLTLFYKPHSIIVPDYYLHKISNVTWVKFPWG